MFQSSSHKEYALICTLKSWEHFRVSQLQEHLYLEGRAFRTNTIKESLEEYEVLVVLKKRTVFLGHG